MFLSNTFAVQQPFEIAVTICHYEVKVSAC